MMRRMGKRWQRLIGWSMSPPSRNRTLCLGAEADIASRLRGAAILTLLLGIRVFYLMRKVRSRRLVAASR
jgi:hypothetical protein